MNQVSKPPNSIINEYILVCLAIKIDNHKNK